MLVGVVVRAYSNAVDLTPLVGTWSNSEHGVTFYANGTLIEYNAAMIPGQGGTNRAARRRWRRWGDECFWLYGEGYQPTWSRVGWRISHDGQRLTLTYYTEPNGVVATVDVREYRRAASAVR